MLVRAGLTSGFMLAALLPKPRWLRQSDTAVQLGLVNSFLALEKGLISSFRKPFFGLSATKNIS